MLEPVRDILSNTRVILASASPRRKEILEPLNLPLEILPSSVEENLSKHLYQGRPHDFAVHTAEIKTDDVFARVRREARTSKYLLVIGSDTVVSLGGTIYGKPTSTDNAVEILSLLSGRHHEVYTGVKLVLQTEDQEPIESSFYEKTEVEFANLNEETIRAYVDTKEPMDKAGAYGIQALGGSLVKGIKGDYFNVMGFPLHSFCVQVLAMIQEMKTKEQ